MHPEGLIAIPGTEVMWTEAAIAIARMIRNAPGTAHVRMDYSQLPVIEKRNWFVAEFLEHSEWSWLLFLDSDMVPPATLVDDLLTAGNRSDCDLLSALCYTRHGSPYHACAGSFSADDEAEVSWITSQEVTGSMVAVDWVGTGALLIWRNVLDQLKKERGNDIFQPDPLSVESTWGRRGEDQEFCRVAKLRGFRTWCHTGIPVGHVGLTNITPEFGAFAEEHVTAWPQRPRCYTDF